MRAPRLRNRILCAVVLLLIFVGLTVALVVARRYETLVRQTAFTHGDAIARSVALMAVEKIKTNDFMALNGLIRNHVSGFSPVVYVLITYNDRVVARVFVNGAPPGLLRTVRIGPNQGAAAVRIKLENGDRYIDIVRPFPADNAGCVRVGLDEKSLAPFDHAPWRRALPAAAMVLLPALCAALFVIWKLTKPWDDLVRETQTEDDNRPFAKRLSCKHEEIIKLAMVLDKMKSRAEDRAMDCERQAAELDQVRRQLLFYFEVIRTVGVHTNLYDVCNYLVGKLSKVLMCRELALVTAGGGDDHCHLFAGGRLRVVSGAPVDALRKFWDRSETMVFIKRSSTGAAALDNAFKAFHRVGVLPFRNKDQNLGALILGCPDGCQCRPRVLEGMALMLQECSGAIKRGICYVEEHRNFDGRLCRQPSFCGIVGKDRRMQTVFRLINDIAPSEAAVLIQGESGTGKELVARAIHDQSPRKEKPFVVINCSAYPVSLLESELFGHEKGAFTGAIRKKIGRFEQADGGTVFLDEIGEIAPSAQIMLLRVLQTNRFERVGGEQTIHVRVRVIAATNKDLVEQVRKGRFREDLYYRLNVIPINLPPLRKRSNDIPLLAHHFLNRFKGEHEKTINGFGIDTMRILFDYSWPGNVRELENTIEHALVLTKGDTIEAGDLPAAICSPLKATRDIVSGNAAAENEKKVVREILGQTGWNKKLAAKRLGISRSTLYNKIKKYRLAHPVSH